MMGKKRNNTAQKTKEISVAMAEASSTGGGGESQSNNTPRKRGRPKKIVVQEEEKKEIQTHVAQKQDEDEERQKDLYPITDKVEEQTSLMAEKRESLKEDHQPKSKARRRKSKPHKSS